MNSKAEMVNPHEQQQSALLARIINSTKALNESVYDMNLFLHKINSDNKNIDIVAQMWENYSQNAEYNLEATGQKRKAL